MGYKVVDSTTNEYKTGNKNIDDLLSLVGQIPDEEIERRECIVSEDVWNIVGIVDSPCSNCSNNAKNGGSGICHCILGNPVIY